MSVSTLAWTDAPLLGFDTETTGTNVARDRIVTVALVHSVGPGREGETVATWLIDPEMEIPEPAQRVHGISTEHARAHGMKAAEALDEVAALIAEALAKEVPLVAFNISFDLAILENELTRLGLPLAQRLEHRPSHRRARDRSAWTGTGSKRTLTGARPLRPRAGRPPHRRCRRLRRPRRAARDH